MSSRTPPRVFSGGVFWALPNIGPFFAMPIGSAA